MSGKYIKDQAYDEIREKIINCEYEPGEALSELELTKELGFGRTPLHNAFIRLAAEGLVTLIPKKGVIVNGISLNDQLEIFDVRLMIEPELIRKYGDSIELSYLDDYTVSMAFKLKLSFHAIYRYKKSRSRGATPPIEWASGNTINKTSDHDKGNNNRRKLPDIRTVRQDESGRHL